MHRAGLLPYLLLAPYLLLFVTFVVVPMGYGLWISLHRWNALLPDRPWVGLENYLDLLRPGTATSGEFWASMRATGIFTVLAVPSLVAASLLVALLLNERVRGRAVFRAIFFAPFVLGVAVVGTMWQYLTDTRLGIVNAALGGLGLPDDIPWTSGQPWVWVTLVGVTVWWTLGFDAVILLAGLQNIDSALYDAAAVDGAGRWQRFRHVTLPGLRPVLVLVTTLTIVAAVNVFGQVVLITGGGPGTDTRTVIMYIANEGLANFRLGSAAAMSYVLFVVVALLSLLNLRFQRTTD